MYIYIYIHLLFTVNEYGRKSNKHNRTIDQNSAVTLTTMSIRVDQWSSKCIIVMYEFFRPLSK